MCDAHHRVCVDLLVHMSIVRSEKLAGRLISLDHVRLAVITDISLTVIKLSINPF